ncbi:hypothetical protein C1646_815813 [Rhizophagus diaphanus]|nr:hypothetical protein C1646_815813 [Rhizophagus diaphanus] [Rhizophagus sp. MUCL 43196]
MSNSLIKHDSANSYQEKGKYADFTELKKVIWKDNKDYFESIGVKSDKKNQAMKESPPKEYIHIIIQPLLTTTVERSGEYKTFNRKPVDCLIKNFWINLYKAQIILKLPDHINTDIYSSEPYSKYMRVEGNEVILGEHIMLNSHNELIFDNGEPVADNITMNSVENNELILDNDEPMTDNITMDSVENKDNGIGKSKPLYTRWNSLWNINTGYTNKNFILADD